MDKSDAMWYTSLATFGVGDVVTTYIGMKQRGVEEGHPLLDAVIEDSGVAGMVGMKAMAFALAGAAYSQVSEDHRIGIPIGLTLLGSYATIHNTRTIMIGREWENEQ